jgi:hypothetical protein
MENWWSARPHIVQVCLGEAAPSCASTSPNVSGPKPGMEYQCYSDASYHKGPSAAYGIVVVSDKVMKSAGIIQARSSLDAEIKAIATALQSVPSGSSGVAYCDLKEIDGLLANMVSYAPKERAALRVLKDELSRTGLSIVFVPRNERSHYHAVCHRLAYKRLKRHAVWEHAKQHKKQPKPLVIEANPLILETDQWNAALAQRPWYDGRGWPDGM